ncbi:MAG TPA: DMT family transporter [Acidimicrobiia bacterium]|nr:DMT family transporter [Acidimicrobiia bacterium]
MVLTVVLALGAGLCYATAAVVQQRVAAQQPPELSLSLRLILQLARRPLWLAGIGVDILAYLMEAAALGVGSVVVVGPLLASGLLFALPFASFRTGRRITRREMIPAFMVTAGLALYVGVGAPGGNASHASRVEWLIAIVAVAAGAGVAVFFGRRTQQPGRRAMYYGLATGIVYSLTAVLTKATVDRIPSNVYPIFGHWQLYALLIASGVGLVLNQSAFQAGHVAASLPVISVTNPVLSSVMGIVLFGEHLDAHGLLAWLVAGGAIVAMLVGTFWLARSPLVTEEVGGVPALQS